MVKPTCMSFSNSTIRNCIHVVTASGSASRRAERDGREFEKQEEDRVIRQAERTGQSKEEETQRYDVKASIASSKRPRKVRNMSAKALVRALDHIISEEGNVEGTGEHDVMEEDSMLLEGMKPPKFTKPPKLTKPHESTKARQGSKTGQKYTE